MTDRAFATPRPPGGAEARLLDLVRARFDATRAVGGPFFAAHAAAIARACEQLAARFERGGTLLVFGAGAQASDAQHVAVEFVHPIIVGKRALPAIALTSDAGVLTGAHGSPLTDAFAGPLLGLAQPGDVALALCGGTVPPGTAALLAEARRRGLLTMLLSGGPPAEGARAHETPADHHFAVPEADALVVQEIHETLYHVLWELVHVFFEHQAPAGQAGEGDAIERQLYPFLFGATAPDGPSLHEQVRDSVLRKWADTCDVRAGLLKADGETITCAARALAQRVAQGGRLLAFGNGGSATDAQDAAADSMAPPFGRWRAFPALALANDMGVVTAVANDVGFEHVFARQIMAFGRPHDIALGISTSGTSQNVLLALAEARARGLLTIALSGYEGGPLSRSDAVDFCVTAPGDYIPRTQEAHATTWHALLAAAQAELEAGSAPATGAS